MSSGRRSPFSSACSTGCTAAVFFWAASCARTWARFSRYSTYARAVSCSPERISASSTWSWMSSMWKVPPVGWRRMSAPTTPSVSRATTSRMRADAAP